MRGAQTPCPTLGVVVSDPTIADAPPNVKGSLGYSTDLELRLLAALCSQSGFAAEITPHLHPNLFTLKAYELWAKAALGVWAHLHKLAPLAVYEQVARRLVGTIGYEDMLPEDVSGVAQAIGWVTANEDLAWVIDDASTWVQRQLLLGLSQDASRLLDRDPAAYRKRLQHALQMGGARAADPPISLCSHGEQAIAERLAGNDDRWVPTGMPRVDTMLFGGLREAKMGCVLAAARGGKTTYLLNVSAGAAMQGFVVLHITHEVLPKDLEARIHTCLTGVPTAMLRTPDAVERVRALLAQMRQYGGDVLLHYWPRGTATVANLHATLDDYQSRGVHPNLVVCDYPNLWRDPAGVSEERLKVGGKYADFFTFCRTRKIPGWCAHQGNRAAHHRGRIGIDNVAEDWSVMGTTDVAVLISATAEMEERGVLNVEIGKNRDFPDGQHAELEFCKELQRIS